jgi:hypothetical protein
MAKIIRENLRHSFMFITVHKRLISTIISTDIEVVLRKDHERSEPAGVYK